VHVFSNTSLTDKKCFIRVCAAPNILRFDLFVEGDTGIIAHALTPRELVNWALFERGAGSVRHDYDLAAYEAAQKK